MLGVLSTCSIQIVALILKYYDTREAGYRLASFMVRRVRSRESECCCRIV